MIKAKYTIVLKTLLDDGESVGKIMDALSKYPVYTPPDSGKIYDLVPSRIDINRRLLDHYKYREIGFETFGRFLDELEITMAEIMPRYNELLKTVVTMADLPSPFDNVDVVETFHEKRNDKSTSEGTTENETSSTAQDKTTTKNDLTSNNKQVQSQTPQNSINIPAKDIDSVPYADQVNWGKDTSNSEGESTSNGTTSATAAGSSSTTNESNGSTEHTYTKKGNQGVNTYAHDMLEYRTQIIDVVDQIIHDPRINELFMLVY